MTDPELLRAYLRQLVDLGAPDLFPQRLDQATLAARLRAGALEHQKAGHDLLPGAAAVPDGGLEPPPLAASAPGPDNPYAALRAEALACTRCRLATTRKQVVFSDGNPNARLAVVGEAPGAREDDTGLPFVGPAGQLLDLMLATVGFSREDTAYICNILKCRPPGNRNPLPDEIETCTPYLERQIELVGPEVILAVGSFAAQYLTGKAMALGKLRGQIYTFRGTPLVVTYHPAALLRNGGWTRPTWHDLQLLRQVMDSKA